jgi:glycosyltransferase involved in cell wall biosynthesis
MNDCFFIANNNIGDFGLSGGDRIFVELAKGWKERIRLTIVGTEEAITLAKREGLSDIGYKQTSPKLGIENVYTLKAIFLNFILKLIRGVRFTLKNKKIFAGSPVIYSVSDFYPDFMPAWMIKLFNPACVWIAAFYLFAPAPWQKDNPYRGKEFWRGFLFWLSQIPAYWLINRYADYVFVTSEPDKMRFITRKRNISHVFVIKGGVDIKKSSEYLSGNAFIPFEKRKYDACFVGRFHMQKGTLLLVDIWKKVVAARPGSQLAMIGNGPLENDVQKKIRELGLADNIELFGFLDGEVKFDIFKNTRLILHPATFDSGGMAAAEAMAWGLPGVSFDLQALKTYYPKGMVKVPLNDIETFATEIIRLLDNKEYYEKVRADARDLIVQEWDWEKRAQQAYAAFTSS